MQTTLDFTTCYESVRPIVLRLKSLYTLKLWDKDDWEQEAMISLYELLNRYPDLANDPHQLRVYFKTKFSNIINDELRKQESKKRQFNKISYEDINTVSHLIPSKEMLLDDFVVFQDSLNKAKAHLKPEELAQLDHLMAGRSFKGRKKLIRHLQELMA